MAERITSRTRAVIFVGLGGNSGRLEDVARLCRERELKLIVDASHMSGTRLNGRYVGSEDDVSVFSFHAVKNLPTADSGMICFADAEFDAEVRHWTWLLGMSPKEIDEKIESIAAVSNPGEFLDIPVRHYSTGMCVRLAFATSTAVDPQILLLAAAFSTA